MNAGRLIELYHAEDPAQELLERLGWTQVPWETTARFRAPRQNDGVADIPVPVATVCCLAEGTSTLFAREKGTLDSGSARNWDGEIRIGERRTL